MRAKVKKSNEDLKKAYDVLTNPEKRKLYDQGGEKALLNIK